MNTEQYPTLLFNTSIATTDGTFTVETISPDEAREIAPDSANVVSAIGHQATAELFSEILGYEVEVNRMRATQKIGQIALVLQLSERPEEGTVLRDVNEIERMGYTLKKMVRTA